MARGDLNVTVQLKLIESGLQADPSINYLVVFNTGAVASASILRAKGKTGQIKVVDIGMDPQIYELLKKGEVIAAATDSQIAYSRIAVDMAVRMLEHQPVPATRTGAAPAIIRDVVKDADIVNLTLAPKDFKATYTVTP
jgi:periplasmic protein TorT